MDEVLAFRNVSKSYGIAGGATLHALREVSVELRGSRVVSLIGRSGSGKSTFLHLAAGIDAPSSGEVRLMGRNLAQLSDRERTLARRREVGLVFQFFHLLPHLSVEENVLVPALIAGGRRPEDLARAALLLERVGLAHRAADRVAQLSGGEMQRVAIARALLRRPRLLLADEPTGNLDEENGQRVMELLLRLTREEESALLYVTHSRELAALADERWRLHGGAMEPA
ncbi:MAG TPA: ABC transporter ATP-binding protein [Anaeromyxobacteraceae bacterium]|jgi:ABC-type lipoprotein export system ATPase subunit|nr:ABC transporter ATP-binding protein [Anaeromyxobacteraceae bacterium]